MDQGFFAQARSFKITDPSLRSDNDFLDRLNHYYTTVLIVIFTVVISAKQYVGKPLQCWVKAEFSDQWEAYAENYCWVKNTYFVPMNRTRIPDGVENRSQYEINYYQYVPFILALMALAFNLPNAFWKILNFRTGVNIGEIVESASSVIRAEVSEREGRIASIASHLKERVGYQMDDKNRKAYMRSLKTFLSCLACHSVNGFGSFLTVSYLASKVLYCVTSIGLLYTVSLMLDSEHRAFSPLVFWEMLNSKSWESTGIFPRITHCDFEIRKLAGNRHPYSIQCVLMINLFNEKIFSFLWMWFLLLSVLNVLGFLYWLLHCLPFQQTGLIRDYLQSCQAYRDDPDQRKLSQFVRVFLKNDGILMLRLISSNAGHLVTTNLVHKMWTDRYVPKETEKDQAVKEPEKLQESTT